MSSATYTPPENPFEMVDTPFAEHKMERWRNDAMSVGVTSAYSAYMRETFAKFDSFRSDTASFVDTLITRERDLKDREDAVAQWERVVADLMGRCGHLMDRLDRRMSDTEKFEHEPITAPPHMGETRRAPCGSRGQGHTAR
jgi:hypothetical protein